MASLFSIRKPPKVGEANKTVVCCSMTADQVSSLSILGFALIEMFQVIMGTLLMVVIPQQCGNDNCTPYQVVSSASTFGGRVAVAGMCTSCVTCGFDWTFLTFTFGQR